MAVIELPTEMRLPQAWPRGVAAESSAAEISVNRTAFERDKESIRANYAGKYVVFAGGQVVGSASDFAAAQKVAEELNPPSDCVFVFPAESEPLFDPPNRQEHSELDG